MRIQEEQNGNVDLPNVPEEQVAAFEKRMMDDLNPYIEKLKRLSPSYAFRFYITKMVDYDLTRELVPGQRRTKNIRYSKEFREWETNLILLLDSKIHGTDIDEDLLN